ncbi:potassium-transporting ATPase subunit KdpA (plasmid) [Deinococcus sp. KNUC1210]|uniref:potassium-transporting ATPase subunit KdpA n=1 Tax=Deinococcus sp. KNUC1210 TaxID=2917691 RepID=UPI001EF0DDB0|nr:potassium-transporting ATPase subunit KdpA [Deinococcus sp. KNUC1210]ULH17015.1 potassium-transporting ATPase subunit KdpA [Deinococcus sp. KNUC1210]
MTTFLTFGLTFLLAWPLGLYIARFMRGERTFLDVLKPLEHAFYRLMGVRFHPDGTAQGMDWKGYARALLFSNLLVGLAAFLIYVFQAGLPLNPDKVAGMPWYVALNTAASFITNTNWQNYSGQSQLSYLSQMVGITALQIMTPAAGMAVMFALLRGLMGGQGGQPGNLGNYFVDITRLTTRLLVPVAFVVALLLTWQGVPSTFSGAKTANLLQPQTVTVDNRQQTVSLQTIPVGPVAALVAIKQIGTNGGGWYGPNSAVPLENPTPLSNLIECISLILIPVALIFALGRFLRRPRFGVMILGIMSMLAAVLTFSAIMAERAPNAALRGLAAAGPNLEGKEVRFGADATALWASLTTSTSNGSVNGMHDSFTPLGGMIPQVNMFLNDIFGGLGVGFINMFLFVVLTVFIAGLMVGRTPELFGRKIEVREMKIASLVILLQPLLILGLTAVSLAVPSLTANLNPGFHGLSEVLYAFNSMYANNGSAFAGLGTGNSVWYNVAGACELILARFLPIIGPLAIAGLLSVKRVAPETSGTLRVDTPIFATTLLTVMLLLQLLNFAPALVLGGVSEQLVGTPAARPSGTPVSAALPTPGATK